MKAKLGLTSTLSLSVLAGIFIGIGGIYFTFVTSQISINSTFTQLIGGIAFSLGLILVVIAGAELFTGNNLMSISLARKKISFVKMIKNWVIVYFGNFIGSILIASLFYMTEIWKNNDSVFAIRAITIATTKVNLDISSAFFLGILCNILVCLAIWLATSGKSVMSKTIAIVFPISAFVALGFEHSIANMYFLSIGMLLTNDANILNLINSETLLDISKINWEGFFVNIIPVTIGNILGGSIFIGILYWIAYFRK